MSRVEGRSDRQPVNATFIRDGEKAWRVCIDGMTKDEWFPKSECDIDPPNPDEGDDVTVWVPEWLLRKKGLT